MATAAGSRVARSRAPFLVAREDLAAEEVHIVHSQAAALEQSETGAVEQRCHQGLDATERAQQRPDLFTTEHHGQPRRPFGPDDLVEPAEILVQHLAVEKEQGAEGLVLRGHADLRVDREVAEEVGDFRFAHLGGMPLLVEQDEAPDPAGVGLLRATAVVPQADGGADLVE